MLTGYQLAAHRNFPSLTAGQIANHRADILARHCLSLLSFASCSQQQPQQNKAPSLRDPWEPAAPVAGLDRGDPAETCPTRRLQFLEPEVPILIAAPPL
jgi:hypothetical protein